MTTPQQAVAVFGGSGVRPSDPMFDTAQELGAKLAGAGHSVLTGGYFGLMEATSAGARQAGGEVIGVTLSSFDPKLPNGYLTAHVHTHDLHRRIQQMLRRSWAVVVLPGGLGTLVETALVWLLKQVGQLDPGFPVIIFDRELEQLLRDATERLLIDERDVERLEFARSAEDVLQLLEQGRAAKCVRAPITIGIAAWNAGAYVEAAVASALAQTIAPAEIIVVDDGSDDDTASIVERLRVHGSGLTLLKQDNRGTANALNRAMRACSTSHMIGLDADDLLAPTAIERFWESAVRHPEAALTYSDHVVIDEAGREVTQRASASPEQLLARLHLLHERLAVDNTDNFLPAGHGRMYDVDRVLSIGGYADEFRYSEDYDLVIRLAARWPCVHIAEVLYQYRWHSSNKGIWGRDGQVRDVRESFRRHLWRTADG